MVFMRFPPKSLRAPVTPNPSASFPEAPSRGLRRPKPRHVFAAVGVVDLRSWSRKPGPVKGGDHDQGRVVFTPPAVARRCCHRGTCDRSRIRQRADTRDAGALLLSLQ